MQIPANLHHLGVVLYRKSAKSVSQKCRKVSQLYKQVTEKSSPLPKQLLAKKNCYNLVPVAFVCTKANQSLAFNHSRHVLAFDWDWVPSSTSSVSSDIRFARQSSSEPTNLSKRPVNAASSFYQHIYTTTHFTSAQWLGWLEDLKLHQLHDHPLA